MKLLNKNSIEEKLYSAAIQIARLYGTTSSENSSRDSEKINIRYKYNIRPFEIRATFTDDKLESLAPISVTVWYNRIEVLSVVPHNGATRIKSIDDSVEWRESLLEAQKSIKK